MSTAALYTVANLQNDALSLAKAMNTALTGDTQYARGLA